MWKVIRGILVFFGIVFILVFSAVLILFGIIHDETDNTYIELNNTVSAEQLLNSKITYSLNNFEDELVCEFSKDELNEFVYSLIKDISVFKGVYIDISEENGIIFELPIELLSFRTCAKGNVKIEETDNGFLLQVKSVKLGNINAASGLLKNLIFSGTTVNTINKALVSLGITSEINAEDLSIDVSRNDLINMVANLTENDENSDLFVAICELCLNNKTLVKFNFGKDKKIGVSVDINSLLYSESYGTLDYSYEDEFDVVKGKVDEIIKNGAESGSVTALYNYYISGYDSLTTEEKKVVDLLDLSRSEEGIKPVDQTGMAGVFKKIAFPTIIFTTFTVPVKQASFNSIFSSLDFIGKGVFFDDGEESAYILVENLQVFLNEDDKIKMMCVVNVNGTRLCVLLDCDSPSKEGLQIDANVSTLKLGTNDVTSVTPTILRWLSGVLVTEDWITISPD